MLYYCKTAEDFARIIEEQELFQGTNLDDTLAVFANEAVFEAKQIAAQGELEQYLAGRFNIVLLRAASIPYLVYAHAVFIWWGLEINGEGRELVRQKYEDVIKLLQTSTAFVLEDGSIIGQIVPTDPLSNLRRGARIAQRKPPVKTGKVVAGIRKVIPDSEGYYPIDGRGVYDGEL